MALKRRFMMAALEMVAAVRLVFWRPEVDFIDV